MDQKERNELIIKLWDEGHSGGRIAAMMVAQGISISRNAVIGVASRSGRKRDGTRTTTLHQVHRQKPAKHAQAPYIPPAVEAPDEPEPISIPGEGTDGCQYIKGEVTSSFVMCGHPRKSGARYCEWHLDNVIKPPDGRTAEGKARKATAVKRTKARGPNRSYGW